MTRATYLRALLIEARAALGPTSDLDGIADYLLAKPCVQLLRPSRLRVKLALMRWVQEPEVTP
jgi:hypothetical protein